MSPKPPSSPDGSSLPPRHRPALGSLSKDTTETDLWDFDDIDPLDVPPPVEAPKPVKMGIPAPRDTENVAGETVQTPDFSASPSPRQENAGGDSVSVNISKKSRDFRGNKPEIGLTPASSHSRHGSDFDELDQWEESEPVVTPPKTVAQMPVSEPMEPVSPERPTQAMTVEPIPASRPEPADDMDEFSPKVLENPTPASLRPKLNLTKIEFAGLAALLVLILIGGGIFYFNTISRLPTGIQRAEAGDFPIKGHSTNVISAVTFWRVPVTSGANADTVRRDALLIPVVELAFSGGPSAIRIFFRNSDGQLVGDAVSHKVTGGAPIQFAATDGFNDPGMHAAYRTGQSKPWTFEVLEGPSEDSPSADFKKLFEMNIAPDRR